MASAAQSVSILMLIAAAGLASVGWFGLQNRRSPGARGFSIAMFGAAAWTIVLSVNIWPTKFLPTYVSMTLRNGLILVILLGWFLLVIEYVNRERVSFDPLTAALVLVIPVLTIIVTATNPLHHLAIGPNTPEAIGGGPNIDWGPWHLVFMTYAFLISLASALLLMKDYMRAHGIHRRQLLLLLGGFGIGFLGINDYLLTGAIEGIPSYVRVSPFVILVTGGLWAIAVFRHQLFDLVPISRRTVVETMPDPVIAVDRSGRIIDANPAARTLCDVTADPTGMPLTEFCRAYPEIADQYHAGTGPEEVAIEDGDSHRYFSVTNEPVGDGRVGTIILLRDITDRKDYERELEAQRDNLEVLNQVVRHDIRNELQIVLAYGDMLDRELDGKLQTYVEQVQDAAREAVDITTTARDVTEVMLQEGRTEQTISLRPVLEEQVEDVRSNFDGAVVTFDGSIPDVTVIGDEMVSSVFRNLLTNAIKHNDKEIPEVSVSATEREALVRIRIADNGPGIPDTRKKEVFEHGEMGLDSEGTGLGLYLVDTLVDRYNGDVHVEDNDPEGAVFVVELPIADSD